MNDSHSDSNSELTQEVRNGFIDLRSLHSRIAEERNELNQKNHVLLCLLTALAFAIVFCLLSLNVRLFKILEANPGLEPNSRTSAVSVRQVDEYPRQVVPNRAP
jgi:hypothetical protein